MITVVRLARVAATLVLAAVVLSLVVGVARPETGALEKGVLLVLIAGCLVVAAYVQTWATRAQARLRLP